MMIEFPANEITTKRGSFSSPSDELSVWADMTEDQMEHAVLAMLPNLLEATREKIFLDLLREAQRG